jgi:ABC-type uncharacterized transport system substrate-binding protein
MDRRTFVAGTVALLAATLAAEAQAGKVYRIGVLALNTAAANEPDIATFRRGLRDLGYVEGQNVLIEPRFADRAVDRLPALAADLVRLNVDTIVTITTPAAQAAKSATSTIPIVMAGSADPVKLGLIASLARPGGNTTGVTNNPGPEFPTKQLQLLKEAAPKVSRVAVLMTSHEVEVRSFNTMHAATPALGVTPISFKVENPAEIDLTALTRLRADGLYVFPNSINGGHYKAILDFAAANRLPAIYGERDAVDAGGLMSYSVNWLELRRHAAVYVDKILKGAKPADLPVQDPTKFELVINLKTAKGLGLTIPPSLLARADEVIQ